MDPILVIFFFIVGFFLNGIVKKNDSQLIRNQN